MKPHQFIWLFCFIVCFTAACTKQAEPVNSAIASSRENATAINQFNSADFLFVTGVNNPYFPLKPGTDFHFINLIKDGADIGYENEHAIVTSDIKQILGVNCTVVHDQLKVAGQVTEDTYDWYAQDKFGNVWYFGEDTKARTDNGWSTEGSWEAGKDGAKPGIFMFANPAAHIGQTYYQEFLPGVAEDEATLLNTNSTVTVPYGSFSNCVKTKEFTKLEPDDIEYKYYAYGVGQVLGVSATERDELVDVK